MTAEQIKLNRYLERMAELLQVMPQSERQAYLAWERSDAWTRDSDWPGWVKYLGPRPELNPHRARRAS